MTLREFDPARDYAAFAALGDAIEPDYPSTEAEVRAKDAMREAKICHHRLVAEADGRLIGRASAGNSSWSYDPRQFHIDLGVHPDWRRKGIALALKLRAIEYARARGVPQIRTDNASTNQAMLSINEALGFERQPAWVSYALLIAAA